MPLRVHSQAKDKAKVLAEIKKKYPGASSSAPPRIWKESNFNFKAPSDGWINGLNGLAAIEVELKWKTPAFEVWLKGESKKGEESSVKVGTITEGN